MKRCRQHQHHVFRTASFTTSPPWSPKIGHTPTRKHANQHEMSSSMMQATRHSAWPALAEASVGKRPKMMSKPLYVVLGLAAGDRGLHHVLKALHHRVRAPGACVWEERRGEEGSVARCVIEPVDHRVRAPGACVQNRCDCACGVPVHSGVPSECKLQSAPDKWGYTPGHCYANGMRRVTLKLCHLCHLCHQQSVALHLCHL